MRCDRQISPVMLLRGLEMTRTTRVNPEFEKKKKKITLKNTKLGIYEIKNNPP